MSEIHVLVEHRLGELRDVTFEMLTKAYEISEKTNSKVVSVILGRNIKEKAEKLSKYSDEVLVVDDEKLEHYNSDVYQIVLEEILKERKPWLLMIAHTSYGVELAPSLAVSLNAPIVTDCIDLNIEDGKLIVIRQVYGGKLYAKIYVKKTDPAILTIRQGVIQTRELEKHGEISILKTSIDLEIVKKKFIEYVAPTVGEVDITSADVIIAIGRGIKDRSNIPLAEELAKLLGGVLACSRPIVDKGWLPQDRQVGSSGKTVKPKLYIALGISGAFQHILGMKNSQLIVAINKDPNAPIFNVSHYGVVEDLFKIVPTLIEKIKEIKKRAT